MTDVIKLCDITVGDEITPHTMAAEQVARAFADLAYTPGHIEISNFISVPEITAVESPPEPPVVESPPERPPGVTCIANFSVPNAWKPLSSDSSIW